MTPIKLDKDDVRHWHPSDEVTRFLLDHFGPSARVLEVGPGTVPFARADVYVDIVDLPGVPHDKLVKCDITSGPLPFPDKSFDFVFCRHMLEDMWDPFTACREMERVAKAGYIETPSPMAELCRGVDGDAPPYRGYHHHRFIVWENEGTLTFVTKYPVVEYIRCDEDGLVSALRQGPKHWNTHFLWSGHISVKHMQSPLDFDIPRDYPGLLRNALMQAGKSTELFWDKIAREAVAA